MRRKLGQLLPLELAILRAAAQRYSSGNGEVHGFELAKLIADGDSTHQLTGHGTLYKALGRLHDGGLLESRWEDADLALAEGRPRRRLYTITALGSAALAHAAPSEDKASTKVGRGIGLEPT